MFLVENKKSSNYQLVYLRAGKRTSVSTGTPNKNEAKKFLASFNPQTISKPKLNKVSIRLNNYITEYKTYVSNTYSESYLKKAITTSFNRLQDYLPDIPIDSISTRQIDQFISSVASNAKYAASLYYRTLKTAFNKDVVWNYLEEKKCHCSECNIALPELEEFLPKIKKNLVELRFEN